MSLRHERIAQMQAELAKKYGDDKPWSFARLADPAGVSAAGVSRVVRLSLENKETGDKILRKLADHWKYSVDWLLTGRGNPLQKELPALDRAIASFDWEPEAIAAARSRRERGKGGDWSEERWRTYLREIHRAAQQAETSEDSPTSAAPTSIASFAPSAKR